MVVIFTHLWEFSFLIVVSTPIFNKFQELFKFFTDMELLFFSTSLK